MDKAFLTNDIENYPSFEHIGGFELMNRFEQQAKNFGAEFVYEEVSSIQKEKERHFTVKTTATTSNNQYDTRTIILAFGKTPEISIRFCKIVTSLFYLFNSDFKLNKVKESS